MAVIPFNKEFPHKAGEVVTISPNLRRLTCGNPSSFTFHGTNTYILGHGSVGIVDPGPPDEAHIARLREVLAEKGEEVSHIIVTHTHKDHSPGVQLMKQWTDATTYGYGPHGIGARRNWPFAGPEGGDTSFVPDVRVPDGGTIKGDGWTLEAIFTPGHISNHLCFALKEDNLILTGDHLMGWSTSIVSPPDGDMAHYMASLHKMLARAEPIYYPGHGGPITDPKAFVEAFIEHRGEREQQILDCLAQHPCHIPEMVALIYINTPEHLHKAAGRSVLSHLLHMVEDGRVSSPDDPPGPESLYRLP